MYRHIADSAHARCEAEEGAGLGFGVGAIIGVGCQFRFARSLVRKKEEQVELLTAFSRGRILCKFT